MPNLPPEFLTRLKLQLGPEYDSFIASYAEAPDIGLRVNTLKLTPQDFAQISPFALTPIPWTLAGFTLPTTERPGKHPYHAAGLYYLQDPAAMAVAELADPQPDERVLDLSAAPGGKATHLAALMQGQGVLIANDIHPRRVQDLAKNLERWGVQNAMILNETPDRLVDHFGAYFDKVLVDAPCSGEGMFRKDPGAIAEWTPKLVESCAVRQDAILSAAAKLVAPGGRLVYSTCTFAPEEDEGTIARFLEAHPDFELVDLPDFAGFAPGRPDWLSAPIRDDLRRVVRLWPHKAPGEGHFIAVVARRSGAGRSRVAAQRVPPILQALQPYFDVFAAAALNWRPDFNRLALRGSQLYYLPEIGPDLHGLRVIHWGSLIGTFKKNRFEPANAFAMMLRLEDAAQQVSWAAQAPETQAYLRGEVQPSTGKNGWVLVGVDGFPLGWGKRVQNRLKSHLPKWLRWM